MNQSQSTIKQAVLKTFFIALAFLATQCTSTDGTPPVINVVEPLAFNIYFQGDSIPIKATITSDDYLDQLEFEIFNLTTGESHLTKSYTINGLSYTLDTFWLNPITDHNDLLIRFNAKTKNNGKSQKGVNIHCDPN